MTELGEIPNEWKIKELKDLYTENIRDFGSFSTTKLIEYVDSGIPYLRSENFRENKLIFNSISYITDEVDKILDKSYVYKGNILFTKIGNIGCATVYRGELGERCNSNATIAKIKIDEKLYNPIFVMYFLNSVQCKKQYIGSIVSTPPRINMGEINKLKVFIPRIEEQEKIAEVLSTVDEQIENTEKLIQKNQELKKGLMQQLLTKGIGHTEFKKTELGYIPKEWEIKKLKEISEVNPRKDILEDYKLVSFIGMEDIDSDGELINKKVREYVSVKKGYTAFRENDVLLAKITPCFENGKRFLARGLENKIGFGSTEFHVLRASEKINSCYLYYIINSYKFKTLAENNMIGSAGQKRVPTDFIKEYELIVPTKEEQEKIVSILSNIDKKVKQYKNKKYKLEILKKGLMQKLLTGAIKV
nr:restriction endonuclease subunit S [Clostridium perfringens]